MVVSVPPENAVFFRNAHGVLDARKALHLIERERGGVADQVDFRQNLLRALHAMDAHLDIRKIL
jgi:hypothetical protein